MSLNVGVLQKKPNDRNMKRNSDGQQFQLSFHNHQYHWFLWFMVFKATFNNISVILWRSDLLVEENRLPGEKHQPATSY
jgi:hypothetical protein